jgi:histidine triad (HIT) family protein
MSECLFCKLSNNNPHIRFEDEHLFILDDINPQAPIHQLIIPKRHIDTLNSLTDQEGWLMGHLIYKASQQAAYYGIEQGGFRLVFNCNSDAGQTVNHIHLHLLGGRLLTWPPG